MFNSLGQDVFFAKEDNDCCTRMCCGPGRPFEMNIVDNLGREIIHLGRNRDMWALGTWDTSFTYVQKIQPAVAQIMGFRPTNIIVD